MSKRPPVVYIHGLIGTLEECANTPALEPCASAAPDLLGYGTHRAFDTKSISLEAQIEHVRSCIETRFGAGPVDLVGHSVGGAIAWLLAYNYPMLVRRVVSVEGNFTLRDAFWSASVGQMSAAEANAMLERLRADPVAWLNQAGIQSTPRTQQTAGRWLAHQPASTLRAMGRSVVATTGSADYLAAVHKVFDTHPVYLLAGERSRSDWDVPDWARRQCAGSHTLARCGHLMMLENEEVFAAVIAQCLDDETTLKETRDV